MASVSANGLNDNLELCGIREFLKQKPRRKINALSGNSMDARGRYYKRRKCPASHFSKNRYNDLAARIDE